ncbi:MAG: hypothetical protein WC975_01810 [Phycisphaerae bacterium]
MLETNKRRKDILDWCRIIAIKGFYSLYRWVTAAPPTKNDSRFQRWSIRVIDLLGIVSLAWILIWGPGRVLILPANLGFHSVQQNNIRVCYDDGTPNDLINKISAYANEAQLKSQTFWGKLPDREENVSIYLCNSRSRYKQLSLGAGGNSCEMVENILLNPKGIGDLNLAAVIAHEMSHVYLRRTKGYFSSFLVPTWLDEGIATYLGDTTWASENKLMPYLEALPEPRVVMVTSLVSIGRWSIVGLNPRSAALQYAHARSFTAFLISKYGKDKLRIYINELSFFKNSNKTWKSIYKKDPMGIEESWLNESKMLKHIPHNTILISNTPYPNILFCLRYIFLFFCLLWIIRQCTHGARLFWKLTSKLRTAKTT